MRTAASGTSIYYVAQSLEEYRTKRNLKPGEFDQNTLLDDGDRYLYRLQIELLKALSNKLKQTEYEFDDRVFDDRSWYDSPVSFSISQEYLSLSIARNRPEVFKGFILSDLNELEREIKASLPSCRYVTPAGVCTQ